MSIGDETLQKILAAVGDLIKAESQATLYEFQTIGKDITDEIHRELERQRLEREDPQPVPAGTVNQKDFWRHLLGMAAAVGLRFDDLYAWVISRVEGGKRKE